MATDSERIVERFHLTNDIDVVEHTESNGWKQVKDFKKLSFVPEFDLKQLRTYSTSPYLLECCIIPRMSRFGRTVAIDSHSESEVSRAKFPEMIARVTRNTLITIDSRICAQM